MTNLSHRGFLQSDLPTLLEFLSDSAKSWLPSTGYLLNSDLIWRLPASDAARDLHLWFHGKELVAYAWYQAGARHEFDIKPNITNYEQVLTSIIQWLETRSQETAPFHPWLLEIKNMQQWQEALALGEHLRTSDQTVVLLSCLDSDEQRKSILTTHGYQASEHFEFNLLQALPTQSMLTSSTNLKVRAVKSDEAEARVQVHRDAWFGSSYSLDRYNELKSLPHYQPELDIVAVTDRGEFAACCIGWLDAKAGIGSIEPLGVSTQFRGSGAAKVMIHYLLAEFYQRGMAWAKLGTAGFNQAAANLYQSCGYQVQSPNRTYVKYLD